MSHHRDITITVDEKRYTVEIRQGTTGSIVLPYRKLTFNYPVWDELRGKIEFMSQEEE